MRRGTALLELVVTMVVYGIVLGLVTQMILFQRRLDRHLQSVQAGARGVRQAAAVLARALQAAAPGDLLSAQSSDSAVELMAPVGEGVGCLASGVVITESASDLSWSSAFAAAPRAGDRMLLLDDRSAPIRWSARTIAAVEPAVGGCPAAGTPSSRGMALVFDSASASAAAAASSSGAGGVVLFRVERRTRYELYRGGDGQWYLGMREWNPVRGILNEVQPVAGPLHAHSVYGARTGLHFAYFDENGQPVSLPADTARVAGVELTARAPDTTIAPARRMVALHGAP